MNPLGAWAKRGAADAAAKGIGLGKPAAPPQPKPPAPRPPAPSQPGDDDAFFAWLKQSQDDPQVAEHVQQLMQLFQASQQHAAPPGPPQPKPPVPGVAGG